MSKFDAILKSAKEPAQPRQRRRKASRPDLEEAAPKRAPGRRSDPAYRQANAYLPKDLHQTVKVELLKEGKEYSVLVEELLTEWLDCVGLEHDEGILKDENPRSPAKQKLAEATEKFLAGDQAEDRELLLRAFAAHSAIDWPDLAATFEDS